MAQKNIYPQIDIQNIQHPNRFYGVPVLGGLVKIAMLIPVGIWIWLVSIAWTVVIFLNSFVVLFTGKYWKVAYELNVFLIKLSIKTVYFFLGITDKYPGFNGETKGFKIDIPYPEHPNRFYAFPIIGGIVRLVGLIPFYLYTAAIGYGGYIGALAASFVVLFTGKYPEGFYEMTRDSVRLQQAMTMYMTGLSDKYPSWWISMNHKVLKIILIIIGALILLNSLKSDVTPRQQYNSQQYQNMYQTSPMPTTSNSYSY